MVASLAGRDAGLTLEPGDEGVDGEALGESVAARGSSRRSRLLSNRGGNGARGRGRVAARGRGRGRVRRRGSGGAAGAKERRTRNGVLDVAGVDVEEDTGVGGSVQLGADNTLGLLGAAASDLDVQALRVVLGTVLLASSVQRNDLVAEDVLAGSEALGDSDGPGVVLADHLDGSPLAVLVTSTLNLGPLEILLLDGLNVTTVSGNVGKDGANVGHRPLGPVELDSATSGNLAQVVGAELGASILVADDVGLSVGVWANEAVVQVLGVPANVLGDVTTVLGSIVVVELEARLEDVINGDTSDGTVGSDGSSKSRNGGNGSESLVHDG